MSDENEPFEDNSTARLQSILLASIAALLLVCCLFLGMIAFKSPVVVHEPPALIPAPVKTADELLRDDVQHLACLRIAKYFLLSDGKYEGELQAAILERQRNGTADQSDAKMLILSNDTIARKDRRLEHINGLISEAYNRFPK